MTTPELLWHAIAAQGGQRVRMSSRWQGDLVDHHVDTQRRMARLLGAEECRVGLVPRRGRSELLGNGSAAWARLESARSCKALQRFLAPTLVVREGKTQRRLAVFALVRPLDPWGLETLNRRLALKLGCVQKWGEPDRLFLAPGTRVLQGRGSFMPCWAEFESDAVYGADELEARLPVLPDRNAWRDAA